MDRIRLFSIIFTVLFLLASATPRLNAETKEKPGSQKTVYFGVITLYHPLVMYRNYQPFMDYLTKHTPYHFELKISQDYKNIITYLRDGSVQVAMLAGLTYLEAKKAAGVIPLMATLREDKRPLCQGIFITRADNKEINTIADIRGKRFAFASERSTSGNLAPLYHLYAREGIRLTDLGYYKNLRYHDSVAREVLRGNFDAGVVLDSVAMKYKDMGIKFIGQTDPLPRFLIVARKGTDHEVMRSLKKALLELNYDNPANKVIMDSWDVNIRYGFAEVADSDYEPIRNMISYLAKEGVKLGVRK